MLNYYVVYVYKNQLDSRQHFEAMFIEVEGLFKPLDVAQDICDNSCYEEVLLVNWKKISKEQTC